MHPSKKEQFHLARKPLVSLSTPFEFWKIYIEKGHSDCMHSFESLLELGQNFVEFVATPISSSSLPQMGLLRSASTPSSTDKRKVESFLAVRRGKIDNGRTRKNGALLLCLILQNPLLFTTDAEAITDLAMCLSRATGCCIRK
ncbi:hypothetical protein O6P43_001420 [Quillaja saponaria]|uniref:Uncharacterized protein n=1 Tax=Quillaja saponaria TaxID=32244 RepID=A0AAD7QIV0_QUISA|nr:hypothetical protein O6P43_001420 [Quillaja saponaria]